jgi:hypothetical protein
MLILSGSPTLANVTFSGNLAQIGGGMGNAINSSPTLTDVTFSGNRADLGGGMFNAEYSSPELTDVSFIGNWANSFGGGMRNELGSNAYLVNVNFDNNYAGSGGGGGMSNDESNPTLINVEFNNNLASASLPGLQNFDSDPQINSILSPSDAADFGGGMKNWNSDPRLLNVTFAGNKSESLGGGMFNYNSNALLINVIFSGNMADSGGGIYNSDSDPELLNVTFSSNHADTTGGGVHNYNDSHPSIDNSIFWGNSPEQVFQEDTSSAAIQDSLVQGGCLDAATCSGTLLTGDPLFVRDPDPGADGDWGTSDDDYGDLQLKVGSPAINAGNNALLPADSWDLDEDGDTSEPIPYDFAYNPRITDTTVDMGAMEATETIYKVYLPLTVR